MNISDHQKIFSYGLFTQWILLGLALIMLGFMDGFYIYRMYVRTDLQEKARLRNLSLAIKKSIAFELNSTNQVLLQVRKELPSIHETGGLRGLSGRFKSLCDAMTGVRTMIVADAAGTILASNRDELTGKNFRDREYFRVPHNNPDPARLYVSQPFRAVTGFYVMNLSHVIMGPGGKFSGIITASLDSEYFKIILSSALYARDMWGGIAHGDGIMFLMVPDREGQTGKNLAEQGSLFTRHRESELKENIFTGIAHATGEESIIAIRSIAPDNVFMDKPIVIAVGRSVRAVFSDWRRELFMQGLLFGIIAVASLSGFYLYQKRQRDFALEAIASAEDLQASEERYRLIAENTSDVVWHYDLASKKFTYVSPSVMYQRGFTTDEAMSQTLEECLTPDSLNKVESLMKSTQEELKRGKFDNLYNVIQVEQPRKDGTTVWTETAATFMLDNTSRPVSIIGISRDISERRKAEESIRNSLMEKEIIIREIHHRVKNNMSIISGFLSLQEDNIKDEDLLRAFRESQQRIRSMSLVHEKLYNSKDLKKINFRDYITVIINELMYAFGKSGSGIKVQVEVSDVELDIDRAIPCGLILNEVITNSFKYAFKGREKGELDVSLVKSGDSLELTVRDTGPGLPPGFEIKNINSLGLQLVSLLANQLRGTFSIRSSGGTEVIVRFPGS